MHAADPTSQQQPQYNYASYTTNAVAGTLGEATSGDNEFNDFE
jgi:hypothetical protein